MLTCLQVPVHLLYISASSKCRPADMPTHLLLPPLLSYIYRPLKCQHADLLTCRRVPDHLLYISAFSKCRPVDLLTPSSIHLLHFYTSKVPTCRQLPKCSDFFWRFNLYVINPKFKMVDLVEDCAVLPIIAQN